MFLFGGGGGGGACVCSVVKEKRFPYTCLLVVFRFFLLISSVFVSAASGLFVVGVARLAKCSINPICDILCKSCIQWTKRRGILVLVLVLLLGLFPVSCLPFFCAIRKWIEKEEGPLQTHRLHWTIRVKGDHTTAGSLKTTDKIFPSYKFLPLLSSSSPLLILLLFFLFYLFFFCCCCWYLRCSWLGRKRGSVQEKMGRGRGLSIALLIWFPTRLVFARSEKLRTWTFFSLLWRKQRRTSWNNSSIDAIQTCLVLR